MIKRNTILANMPPILLALSLLYVGLLGIISTDFGYHWDEARLISSVQNSVSSGLLLPGWYNYPSVSYDVSLLAAAPHLVAQAVRSWGADQELMSEEVVRYLGEPAFHLQLRSIFFLLSMFSVFPVYILVRRLSGSAWIALFAGLTSISTWEFVYHARWIAPDCLLALFISWSLLGQYQILNCENQSRRIVWVIISAIFAGLCIGTKYNGGIVLVPLLLAIAISRRRTESIASSILLPAAIGLLVVAVVFVLTTPGFLLERLRFLDDVHSEMAHYSRGHGGYTVVPGWDHFSKLFVYLASVFLSKNTVLAVMASTLAVLGAAYLVKTQAKISIWFLSLPVFYGLYMSAQAVMIVRNYLVLLPYFAVLMGLGLFAATSAAQSRRGLRFLFGTAAVFFIVYNMSIATKSSLGIFRPNTTSIKLTIESRVKSSPETRFFLSPASLNIVSAAFASNHSNIVETIGLADKLIFLSNEVTDWRLFVGNVPGRYHTVWSRLDEVNWDFYPSWDGHDRVLEVSANESEFGPLISEVIQKKGST